MNFEVLMAVKLCFANNYSNGQGLHISIRIPVVVLGTSFKGTGQNFLIERWR